MSEFSFLAPVFAQVALTFALLLRMGMARTQAVRAGRVKLRDIALGQPNWPDAITQVGRAFHNQLETPQLFYAWAAFAMLTHKTDLLMLALAWVYVLTRLAHAYVHLTTNYVPTRFTAFLLGFILLAAMWLVLLIRLALAI